MRDRGGPQAGRRHLSVPACLQPAVLEPWASSACRHSITSPPSPAEARNSPAGRWQVNLAARAVSKALTSQHNTCLTVRSGCS